MTVRDFGNVYCGTITLEGRQGGAAMYFSCENGVIENLDSQYLDENITAEQIEEILDRPVVSICSGGLSCDVTVFVEGETLIHNYY